MRVLSALLALSVVGCSAAGSLAPIDDEPGAIDPEGLVPGVDEPEPDPSEPAPFVPEVRALGELERDALAVALDDTGVLDSLGLIGRFAVRELEEVATLQVFASTPMPVMSMDPYEGGGIQIDVDVTAPGPMAADFEVTALIAWKGLDVTNQSVDEAVAILAPGLIDAGTVNLALPDTDPDAGKALVYLDNPEGLYAATAGSFGITGITLGNPDPCLGLAGNFVTCEVTEGDVQGTFTIDGEEIEDASTVQVTGSFDLPAIRVSLTDAP